ncbi:class I SAM-dependent rRNA methyltransferase [Listeria ilorinensis]|uniref:class I SAM-dependent rRNA methyltransferase n=1 Tax=Listeria ilorinensis TaxID=2867439 RepID=UPI001EF59A31|nr:class I SAM-dependent rRNA methyltransferase [Listeria ilorinensis]
MEKYYPLQVAKKHVNKYQQGYPLLHKEWMMNWSKKITESTLLKLVSPAGEFIAYGYAGKQNKGDGWLFSFDKKAPSLLDNLQARLQEAVQMRHSYFADETTTAFRLFNGEGDGFGGLTIDYYDGFLLLQWYSLGLYQFKKELLPYLYDLPFVKGIYEKRRFEQEEANQDDFVGGKKATEPLLVKENGMTFAVYLDDGWMTGIFLDQKDVRRELSLGFTAGKTVLNTFSYTGAFSVAALYGGALHTTSVDAAKRTTAKTREQFEVNQLDSTSQTIVVEDVFQYFKYALRKGKQFDVVICDPPSFARTKKTTFQVANDYPELLRQLIPLTATGGTMLVSTNYAGFGMKAFKKMIHSVCSEETRTYRIVKDFSLPTDFRTNKAFPEGNYLKVVMIQFD